MSLVTGRPRNGPSALSAAPSRTASEALTSIRPLHFSISMAPIDPARYPAPVNVRPWHSFQAQLHLLWYIAGSPKDGQLKHSLPNVNVLPLPCKTQGVPKDRMSNCTYRKAAEQMDGAQNRVITLLHGDKLGVCVLFKGKQ